MTKNSGQAKPQPQPQPQPQSLGDRTEPHRDQDAPMAAITRDSATLGDCIETTISRDEDQRHQAKRSTNVET
jgi:hypothetical protein